MTSELLPQVGWNCLADCFYPPNNFGGIKDGVRALNCFQLFMSVTKVRNSPKKDCSEYSKSSFWGPGHGRRRKKPRSGYYIIQPVPDEPPIYAYCDHKTDGGGWTLLMHRGYENDQMKSHYLNDRDGSVNKFRSEWPSENLEKEFGWLDCDVSDHFIGQNAINSLIPANSRMRIDFIDKEGLEYFGYADVEVNGDQEIDISNYFGYQNYTIGSVEVILNTLLACKKPQVGFKLMRARCRSRLIKRLLWT